MESSLKQDAPNGPRKHSQRVLQRYQRIAELWSNGASVYKIADDVGMTVNSVCSLVLRIRKEFGWCKPRESKAVKKPTGPMLVSDLGLPVGTVLYARFKDVCFTATMHADGRVQSEDMGVFKSLSAAAIALVRHKVGLRRTCNGYDFWFVLLRDGRECKVGYLRYYPDLIREIASSPVKPVSDEAASAGLKPVDLRRARLQVEREDLLKRIAQIDEELSRAP